MMQINNDEKPSTVSTHTFNRAAERTIADAMAVSAQRAGEYHDSWSINNLTTPFLDNLLRDFPICPQGASEREYKRLIIMASMIDIKISRMSGGWKKDTSIDLINYEAAYCELRENFGEKARNERNVNGSGISVSSEPGQHIPNGLNKGLISRSR